MSAAPLPISLDGKGPLYRQLDRALRAAILGGRLREGARLPASRELAQALGLSRNVVLTAYAQLTAEGYLEGATGRGTFVASPLPESLLTIHPPTDKAGSEQQPPQIHLSEFARAAQSLWIREGIGASPGYPRRFDFRYGEVAPDTRCLNDWRRLLGRAQRNAPTDYCPPEGPPVLREAIADYLRRVRKLYGECRRALVAALREHFGDRIRLHGINAGIHVLVGFDGLSVEALDARAEQARTAGVGVQTVHQMYLGKVRAPGLLLGYALMSPAQIAEGVAELRRFVV